MEGETPRLRNVSTVDLTRDCRVAMAESLARRTPNHKIVGSSPAKSQSAHQNRPAWARVATMVPRFTQPLMSTWL